LKERSSKKCMDEQHVAEDPGRPGGRPTGAAAGRVPRRLPVTSASADSPPALWPAPACVRAGVARGRGESSLPLALADRRRRQRTADGLPVAAADRRSGGARRLA